MVLLIVNQAGTQSPHPGILANQLNLKLAFLLRKTFLLKKEVTKGSSQPTGSKQGYMESKIHVPKAPPCPEIDSSLGDPTLIISSLPWRWAGDYEIRLSSWKRCSVRVGQ